MFDLRMYGRRPSCIVRYRHGGAAALYPTIEYAVAESRVAAQVVHGGVVEPVETATVLYFPQASERSKRKGGQRPNGRTKGRS